jgi:hypothetical protein
MLSSVLVPINAYFIYSAFMEHTQDNRGQNVLNVSLAIRQVDGSFVAIP